MALYSSQGAELRQFLSDNEISQRTFAGQIGSKQSIVSRIVAGKIRPGYLLAFAIQEATKGEVSADLWVSPQPPKAGSAT